MPSGAHPPGGPVRTCLGCRTRCLMSELLRIVAGDAGLVPDPAHRLPGRGAWIHPGPGCLSSAERRRAFPRALRRSGPLDSTMVREYLGDGLEFVAGAPVGARTGRPQQRSTDKARKQDDPT